MIGNLYCILNKINNKAYIGKTYRNIDERWREHIKDCKRYNRPLHRAIRKYGKESFTVKLLGSFPEGDLELKEKEFILKYNSFKNGYNATLGGDGKRYLEVTDQEVLDAYETSASLKEAATKLNINEDTVRKIIASYNIKIHKPTTQFKKVLIPELGLEFDSVSDCARLLIECEIPKSKNVTTVAGHITRVCNKIRNSYLGFTYVYR